MGLPRFHCAELIVGELALSPAESAHAGGSRRLQPGDRCELFDGCGRSAEAVVLATGAPSGRRAGGVRCRVERVVAHAAPARRLTLVVAGCKGERLEWLVEKCTELGVTRIVLANFARSVVHVDDKHATRLRRTALEASKQCGRMWLPELAVGLDGAALPGVVVVAHRAREATALAAVLAALPPDSALTAFVGPEGGLSPEEIEGFAKSGARLVELGPQSLRVETAAVAIAAAWTLLGGGPT